MKFIKTSKNIYETNEITKGFSVLNYILDTKDKVLMLKDQYGIVMKIPNVTYKKALKLIKEINV